MPVIPISSPQLMQLQLFLIKQHRWCIACFGCCSLQSNRKMDCLGGLGCAIPAPSLRLKISLLQKQKLVCNTTDPHRDNLEMALPQSPSQTLLPCHKHSPGPTRSQSPPCPRMFPALHHVPVLQVRPRPTLEHTPTLPMREGALKCVSLVLVFVYASKVGSS